MGNLNPTIPSRLTMNSNHRGNQLDDITDRRELEDSMEELLKL